MNASHSGTPTSPALAVVVVVVVAAGEAVGVVASRFVVSSVFAQLISKRADTTQKIK